MALIFVSHNHQNIVDQLSRSTDDGNNPIFKSVAQLMLFAAMVGFANNKIEPLKDRKGIEVETIPFKNDRSEGVAYLLAIDAYKDPDILGEKQEAKCWQTLEGHANAGFKIINEWLLEYPSDIQGVETLMAKLKEKALENIKTNSEA